MKKFNVLIGIALCLSLTLFVIGHRVLADDSSSSTGDDTTINEDTLFSDSNTEVKQEDVVNNNVADELEKSRIGISGDVKASSTFYQYYHGENVFVTELDADLLLDARLNKRWKFFASGSATFYPILNDMMKQKFGIEDQSTSDFKEYFLDTNINDKVFFRAGRQVLKWGQGYFWNPTDLINIERKDFSDMDKLRKGTLGLKVQIPSGVQRNIYFFADTDRINDFNDISWAAKYEFLVKNTEMSVSARIKDRELPYWGFDITGRILKCDVRGEISLTDGANYHDKILDYDTLDPKSFDGQLIPRISIGFTKTFDSGDIKERISITPEFYYNSIGYDQNMIQRTLDDTSKQNWLLSHYDPWGNCKYYLAIFSSVNKFIISDMTLNINGIANLVDHSGTLMSGVIYKPALTNWEFSLNLSVNMGAENTEAFIPQNTWNLGVGAKLSF